MTSMARSLPVENLLPQNVGLIIEYLQNATEVAKCGALSCSRPHQLRTMASETVGPIDRSLPSPYTRQYLFSSAYCTVQMGVTNHKTCCSHWDANTRPSECQAFRPLNARRPLRPHFQYLLVSSHAPSSSVPISYFILAFPIRKCLGKHSA